MTRSLAPTVLLALCLSACTRQVPPTPPAAPAAPPAVTQPAAPAPAVPSAAVPTQSQVEQATRAQESGDGAANEHPASSDASLERMAALPPQAQLPGGRWEPGVNYNPLVPAQPTSVPPGQVEVLEVMWLGCPHCYALEPYLRAWFKTKPAYVTLVRVPVIWGPVHRAHAHLFYTLQGLGRPDLIDKAFDTIQQRQSSLVATSENDSFNMQQAWAGQQGIGADDFKNAYNSFSVNSDMQRAEEITQRYHIETVPFIVVNGKYTTDVGKAGSPARLIELIDDLAASEHRP